MSKAPSVETQLRTARRIANELKQDLARLKVTAEQYRIRATQAEQEVSAWKKRFDALLKITPKREEPETSCPYDLSPRKP